VKGVLASYRWRRRLLWFSAVATVAGGAVAVGLIWPNTAAKEPVANGGPVHIKPEPKKVHLPSQDKAAALGVAARFIDTAVVRRNLDASWDLAAPLLRQGFTRDEWDSGNIPVAPYPAGPNRKWLLDYSDETGVGFQIALFPRKGVHQDPLVFLISLHKGHSNKWLVDQWQPAPSNISGRNGGGDQPSGAFESALPNLSAGATKPKESQIWLLVPLGVLSLIIVVPVAYGAVNWYRGRRARINFMSGA
jgi:hypothetical protein